MRRFRWPFFLWFTRGIYSDWVFLAWFGGKVSPNSMQKWLFWALPGGQPSKQNQAGTALGLVYMSIFYPMCLSIKASKKRLLTFTSSCNLSLSYATFITFFYQRCVLHIWSLESKNRYCNAPLLVDSVSECQNTIFFTSAGDRSERGPFGKCEPSFLFALAVISIYAQKKLKGFSRWAGNHCPMALQRRLLSPFIGKTFYMRCIYSVLRFLFALVSSPGRTPRLPILRTRWALPDFSCRSIMAAAKLCGVSLLPILLRASSSCILRSRFSVFALPDVFPWNLWDRTRYACKE